VHLFIRALTFSVEPLARTCTHARMNNSPYLLCSSGCRRRTINTRGYALFKFVRTGLASMHSLIAEQKEREHLEPHLDHACHVAEELVSSIREQLPHLTEVGLWPCLRTRTSAVCAFR
jgi:hypothetical protein